MKLKANVMVIAGKKTYSPGETFEINDDEGRRLVERKLATLVEEQPAKKGGPKTGKAKPDANTPSPGK
ncbi:MAG TPA: hypothetical protein ENI55_02625 [Alphaproteobacteria bacterium]|nr:hypothetical protein [Alphaproteobacteria bacterium]